MILKRDRYGILERQTRARRERQRTLAGLIEL
jgi:hypothetical protein